ALLEAASNGGRDVERERPALAEREQPEDVIHVPVREDDRRDGRVSRLLRPERRGTLDLREDVGRSVDEDVPTLRVRGSHRERVLCACLDPLAPGADRGAVQASAVPLGKASASGGAEDDRTHRRNASPTSRTERSSVRSLTPCRLLAEPGSCIWQALPAPCTT